MTGRCNPKRPAIRSKSHDCHRHESVITESQRVAQVGDDLGRRGAGVGHAPQCGLYLTPYRKGGCTPTDGVAHHDHRTSVANGDDIVPVAGGACNGIGGDAPCGQLDARAPNVGKPFEMGAQTEIVSEKRPGSTRFHEPRIAT